ncbi:MAG: permease [Desulfobacterota bacterium]|nr:permease [Thermodesulfobacteriota bacterium]
MDWKTEWKPFALIIATFLACFYLPTGTPRFDNAVMESLRLVKWYAREHVLLCLIPAFFIAGAISVFVSRVSVMKYLGSRANRVLAYSVASVSGTVLAVCSCTVLPLFGGIYKMGAGLGPAITFLYSGPAINVLAIILSARILGLDIGIARAVGAISFSLIIGLLMHVIFRSEEIDKANAQMLLPESEAKRPLWQTTLYFLSMFAILVFANWGKPDTAGGFFYFIFTIKWYLTGIAAIGLGVILCLWFTVPWFTMLSISVPTALLAFLFPHEPLISFGTGIFGISIIAARDQKELGEWFVATWSFTKQITPLLLAGVLVAGILLGRPGNEGIIPRVWITGLVGGNSLWTNFFASVVGAFMYFATLTEVPIVQGLLGSGMGKGPALALLLAGPALSLPNMLVLNKIMGTKKTVVYCTLVVIMATFSGILFGTFY